MWRNDFIRQPPASLCWWSARHLALVVVWHAARVHMTLIGGCEGRSDCLLVVSVTHAIPPSRRLHSLVMSHHLWLSGTLLSEDNDVSSHLELGQAWQLWGGRGAASKQAVWPKGVFHNGNHAARCGAWVEMGVTKSPGGAPLSSGESLEHQSECEHRMNVWSMNGV